MSADRYIDIEYTLKSLGPSHAFMTAYLWWLFVLQLMLLGVALAAFSGRYIDALLAVGCQYTMIPRQICAWFRN